MGIFKKTLRMIFKKNNGSEKKHNNTLEEDIHLASDWVVKALNSSGYKADYSLESMKEIDRFFFLMSRVRKQGCFQKTVEKFYLV